MLRLENYLYLKNSYIEKLFILKIICIEKLFVLKNYFTYKNVAFNIMLGT